jgi:glycosyltransferase
MGKECNFDNPQTYSEKLQWLKIYDRNPLYTQLVDKYEVRKFIEERIGSEHLIPCLGVWDHFDEIDFNKLPNQFVLKCTHDSGGLIICKDKSTLDLKQARKKIEHCLKRNYFLNHREWPYKDVKPRIIAEEYTVDESGYELKDYKIFCFNGEPKAMFIATDRGTDTKFDFFDTEFHHLPFTNGHPNADKEIKKPENFDEMLRIAGILSKGMPEVRVDLYNVNGKILFGEMTFFHWSGLMPFEPEEWDYKFGSWIELPEVR